MIRCRMKVLVTGGGGFLGTAICKELLNKGYEVFNFSRNEYSHLSSIGVKTRKGNLLDKDTICNALKLKYSGLNQWSVE